MAKAKVSYSRCSLYVEGMDFDCPMCGAKVLSGDRHECGSDVEAEKVAEAAKPKEGWSPVREVARWPTV
jgi:DNA-directed RNA polymerase subunit RPC12/RpoP